MWLAARRVAFPPTAPDGPLRCPSQVAVGKHHGGGGQPGWTSAVLAFAVRSPLGACSAHREAEIKVAAQENLCRVDIAAECPFWAVLFERAIEFVEDLKRKETRLSSFGLEGRLENRLSLFGFWLGGLWQTRERTEQICCTPGVSGCCR